MTRKLLGLATAFVALLPAAAGTEPSLKPLAAGLKNPGSVAVGPNGKVYVSVAGEIGKDGDGAILRLDGDKAVPIAEGLNDPKGIAVFQRWLFVADKDRVLRVGLDGRGRTDLVAPPNAFPRTPVSLDDVVVDVESGTVYVSDSGDSKGNGGAVYRVAPNGQVSLVADAKTLPGLHTPSGLLMDGASHVLVADSGTGVLHRVRLSDGMVEKVAEGLGGADGLAWDLNGRLYVSDRKNGKVFGIGRPGEKPALVAGGFQSAADVGYDPVSKRLIVLDGGAGAVVAILAVVPGEPVDTTPLPLETAVAFPDLKWTGWQPETESGRPNQHRPIVLTHAGDGSGRTFVATQQGVIHVFPNDPKAKATKVFLDISDRVQYDDRTNEEGFLGLAFHPRYKETGEFFVYYTPKKEKNTNLVVRFRVSKNDPDKADPASEEEVYRFSNRPFWNHDGGTVVFGPDGMLYFVHGDGGLGNDPYGNGQNLASQFGKIHRIDVDHKDPGKNYAVPKDNPFVNVKGARPEIWAYGLRNVWRMAFDKKTGKLWAADVGQNLYEEIDLIEKGKNYGWSVREGLHPFGAKGVGPRPDLTDPIWEYHHDVGKSITGGTVYRGKQFPEMEGHYLHADYVTAKIWALKYDEQKGRVVADRPIKDRGRAIMSFGEDEAGELYLLSATTDGKGIFRFARPAEAGGK